MDNITQIIGIMSVEDKPALVALLKRVGSFVTQESTQQELLDATFKAIKDSQRFRDELANYLVLQSQSTQSNASGYSNYVDSGFFNASGLSNALNAIFSPANIQAATSAGIGVLAAKLTANANKGTEQRAIDYQVALAQTAASNAAAAQAQAAAIAASKSSGVGATTTKSSWVMPVAIIGGILLVGTIIFVVVRKK